MSGEYRLKEHNITSQLMMIQRRATEDGIFQQIALCAPPGSDARPVNVTVHVPESIANEAIEYAKSQGEEVSGHAIPMSPAQVKRLIKRTI